MRKIIFSFLFVLSIFCLCSWNKEIEVKDYKDEVTYEEFIEKYKQAYNECSVLNGLTDSNFTQTWFYESILKTSIRVEGESIDSKSSTITNIETSYDIETNLANEKTTEETICTYPKQNRKLKEEKEYYVNISKVKEQFASRFDINLEYSYYKDFAKYYIDGDVFTWTFDALEFESPLDSVLDVTNIIYQIEITNEIITYYEYVKKEKGESTTYITLKL